MKKYRRFVFHYTFGWLAKNKGQRCFYEKIASFYFESSYENKTVDVEHDALHLPSHFDMKKMHIVGISIIYSHNAFKAVNTYFNGGRTWLFPVNLFFMCLKMKH